jgi:UDP-N-acetylmuramate dehydrogenase
MYDVKDTFSSSLSYYKTGHRFKNYAEFSSLEEYKFYFQYAKDNHLKLHILANGSNTLFNGKIINSLILKNKMPQSIIPISTNKIRVTSTVPIIKLLKFCLKNSLDSFYYLASVPATVGGALAMNAGRGKIHNMTIYDFVESVSFYNPSTDIIETLEKDKIVKGYRETIFTGSQPLLIIDCIFNFPSVVMDFDPIVNRQNWSKEHQDNSAPNCGSVFKDYDYSILNNLKGLRIGGSMFSSKTVNWILNDSDSGQSITLLIWVARLFHLLLAKHLELELIIVN